MENLAHSDERHETETCTEPINVKHRREMQRLGDMKK